MLATQAPCQGILVGTWPELIEQAKSAYLIFTADERLEQAFS